MRKHMPDEAVPYLCWCGQRFVYHKLAERHVADLHPERSVTELKGTWDKINVGDWSHKLTKEETMRLYRKSREDGDDSDQDDESEEGEVNEVREERRRIQKEIEQIEMDLEGDTHLEPEILSNDTQDDLDDDLPVKRRESINTITETAEAVAKAIVDATQLRTADVGINQLASEARTTNTTLQGVAASLKELTYFLDKEVIVRNNLVEQMGLVAESINNFRLEAKLAREANLELASAIRRLNGRIAEEASVTRSTVEAAQELNTNIATTLDIQIASFNTLTDQLRGVLNTATTGKPRSPCGRSVAPVAQPGKERVVNSEVHGEGAAMNVTQKPRSVVRAAADKPKRPGLFSPDRGLSQQMAEIRKRNAMRAKAKELAAKCATEVVERSAKK